MTPFQLGMAIGSVVTVLVGLFVWLVASELGYRRRRPVLRSLTAEHRDDSRRTARMLMGSGAVRTPVPGRKLGGRGLA